jgi:hypothetical protein
MHSLTIPHICRKDFVYYSCSGQYSFSRAKQANFVLQYFAIFNAIDAEKFTGFYNILAGSFKAWNKKVCFFRSLK